MTMAFLGACAYDFAEYRKVRLLKENGYNAIRSSHNPCSEAMLRACDELGVLMADEYVDEWYIHKTKHDYADQVEKNFREDLTAIVDRDYNHPKRDHVLHRKRGGRDRQKRESSCAVR